VRYQIPIQPLALLFGRNPKMAYTAGGRVSSWVFASWISRHDEIRLKQFHNYEFCRGEACFGEKNNSTPSITAPIIITESATLNAGQ